MVSTNRGKKRTEETTTIRVRKSTKIALEKRGIFGETHDAIVRRIIMLDMMKTKKKQNVHRRTKKLWLRYDEKMKQYLVVVFESDNEREAFNQSLKHKGSWIQKTKPNREDA